MSSTESVVQGTTVGGTTTITDLAWIGELLWPHHGAIRTSTGSDDLLGYNAERAYVPLPSWRHPVTLVPAAPRAAAATILTGYGRLRSPGRRLIRWSLGRMASAGVLRAVSPTTLTIHARDGVSPSERREADIGAFLTEELGWPVVIGIGLGTPGPNRKPVLQLLDELGRLRAFAKVGWNGSTSDQVATEAAALRTVAAAGLTRLHAPRLLGEASWNGLTLMVTEALPAGIRRHTAVAQPPPCAITAELAAIGERGAFPLLGTAFWQRLTARLMPTIADGGRPARVTSDLIRTIEHDHGDRVIEVGAWHGDWAPWNVGWVDGRLHVWDWEHSASQAPLGFDVLHWHYQVAFISEGLALPDALDRAAERSSDALADLGVLDGQGRPQPLLALYLLEMFARLEAARRAGAGTNPRFHPAVIDVMEAWT